jgi:hypothetical protein
MSECPFLRYAESTVYGGILDDYRR